MEGVTLRPGMGWCKFTAQFLLLSDCHFGHPLRRRRYPTAKRKQRRMHKNVFYTPTHSGETWQFITKVTQMGLSDG